MPRRRTFVDLSGASKAKAEPPDRRVLSRRYRLLYAVGSGAMSTVHLAEHVDTGERVAIKILTAEQGAQAAERFLREAEVTAQIVHANVVEISDFGETPEGAPYYVMEYLDGEHLGHTLDREGPMPWPRVAKFAVQIARGLAAAHERGVVHRDLKPENCVRRTHEGDPDFVTIIDFGVAKALDQERLTQTGFLVGTPQYISPEQARGEPIDHRADIYALGVIIFELLTGDVPFDGPLMQVLASHRYDPVPVLADVAPDLEIPAGVELLIRKALQKQPEHRFATMEVFAAAIEAVAEGGVTPELEFEDDASGRPMRDGPMTFAPSREHGDDRTSSPESEAAPKPGEPGRARRSRGVWIFAGLGVASLLISLAVLAVRSCGSAKLDAGTDPQASGHPQE